MSGRKRGPLAGVHQQASSFGSAPASRPGTLDLMCDANGSGQPPQRITRSGFTGADDGVVHFIDFTAIPDPGDGEATLDDDTTQDAPPEDSP